MRLFEIELRFGNFAGLSRFSSLDGVGDRDFGTHQRLHLGLILCSAIIRCRRSGDAGSADTCNQNRCGNDHELFMDLSFFWIGTMPISCTEDGD